MSIRYNRVSPGYFEAMGIPMVQGREFTTEDVADATGVIIVDGILVLADPGLRDLLDIKVFVDTDPDIRLIRRLRRDIRERGRSVESVVDQYLKTVRPMHLAFVAGSRTFADIIIPEGGRNRVAIDLLVSRLRLAHT